MLPADILSAISYSAELNSHRPQRLKSLFQTVAEGVGFEPTRAFALPVFKTGAINRSTTPPMFSLHQSVAFVPMAYIWALHISFAQHASGIKT
jgi:hypothetical protein